MLTTFTANVVNCTRILVTYLVGVQSDALVRGSFPFSCTNRLSVFLSSPTYVERTNQAIHQGLMNASDSTSAGDTVSPATGTISSLVLPGILMPGSHVLTPAHYGFEC